MLTVGRLSENEKVRERDRERETERARERESFTKSSVINRISITCSATTTLRLPSIC